VLHELALRSGRRRASSKNHFSTVVEKGFSERLARRACCWQHLPLVSNAESPDQLSGLPTDTFSHAPSQHLSLFNQGLPWSLAQQVDCPDRVSRNTGPRCGTADAEKQTIRLVMLAGWLGRRPGSMRSRSTTGSARRSRTSDGSSPRMCRCALSPFPRDCIVWIDGGLYPESIG
jgi:hypothetical protein